jgi:hypothetical protein
LPASIIISCDFRIIMSSAYAGDLTAQRPGAAEHCGIPAMEATGDKINLVV